MQPPPSRSTLRAILVALALFAGVSAAYFECPVLTSYDSRLTVYVAESILHEGNVDLNEYPELRDHPLLLDYGGRKYWLYPTGTPLLIAPAVWIAEHWVGPSLHRYPSLRNYILGRNRDWVVGPRWSQYAIERVLAALIAGATVALLYLVLRARAGPGLALLVSLVFAFATSQLSTASRGLYQQTSLELMLVLNLLCLVHADRHPLLAGLSALPLAFGYVCRPTAAVPILVLSAYVALRYPRQIPLYALTAASIATPWLWANRSALGTWLPRYYTPGAFGLNWSQLPRVALANLISPARGLLVFSPFFVFALPGLLLRRWSDWRRLEHWFVPLLVLHLAVISTFPIWWAGHSYGPRFLIDILPYACLLLAEALGKLRTVAQPWRGRAWALFAALVLASLAVHSAGACCPRCWTWNGAPVNVDADPERVWSWSDAQVLSAVLRGR